MTLAIDQRRRAMIAEMGIELPVVPRGGGVPDLPVELAARRPAAASNTGELTALREVRAAEMEAVEAPPEAAPAAGASTEHMPQAPQHAIASQVRTAPATTGNAPEDGPLEQATGLLAWDPVGMELRPWSGALTQLDWLIAAEWPRDGDATGASPVATQVERLLANMLRALAFLPTERIGVLPLRSGDDWSAIRMSARPGLVLAMGGTAAQALAADQPLGRLRGQLLSIDGCAAVATYAPAYLLRNPADKAKAWADLCFARQARGRAG